MWYKLGIYLGGGSDDSETLKKLVDYLIFHIFKHRNQDLFNYIKLKMSGNTVDINQLIAINTVTTTQVGRFVAAMFSSYVSRDASRKVIKSLKYKSTNNKINFLVLSFVFTKKQTQKITKKNQKNNKK